MSESGIRQRNPVPVKSLFSILQILLSICSNITFVWCFVKAVEWQINKYKQKYDYEIILIDNDSKDNTRNIIDRNFIIALQKQDWSSNRFIVGVAIKYLNNKASTIAIIIQYTHSNVFFNFGFISICISFFRFCFRTFFIIH